MSDLDQITKAKAIASDACTERQPMMCAGIPPSLIAAECEKIGEAHYDKGRWHSAAHAYRLACWYCREAYKEAGL